MKGKSFLILLLVIVVAAGLSAVAYLGVGNVPATSSSEEDQMQVEVVTDENGEPVTDADGNIQVQMATQSQDEEETEEATETVSESEQTTNADGVPATAETASESETEESSETTTAAPRIGYGSYKNIKQGLDLKGGVYIVYEAEKEGAPTAQEMSAAVSMLQGRVEYKGYYDAEVSQEGERRIRVEIPGVDDAAAAVNEIGEAAHLTFRAMNDDGTPGDVLVDGENVTDADKAMQNDQVVVTLAFDSIGAQAFADATAANVGKRIGIYMDDMLLSAPTVNSAINDGQAIITGSFTVEEAEDLASKIRAGSLPFNLKALEYNAVGARLGADSLSTSVKAGTIGIILVLIFMLLRYRLLGAAADLALIIYTALMIVVLSLFGITLTLPGVAGIILSIGMAVDANVIIFERIKEELNAGKALKTAIRNGFSKALSAILDGNITTLIACAVLLWLGTGPIKGFAQTLILGIVVSMFTALFVTRVIVVCLANVGAKSNKLYGAK